MFLIYINDLIDDLKSCPFIFADDTTLFEVVDYPDNSAQLLNKDPYKISQWSDQWLVTVNPSKTRSMTFLNREKVNHPVLSMGGCDIAEVNIHTHLGLVLQNNMSWNSHIFSIYEKASKRLDLLKSLRFKINRSTFACLYKSLIRPIMEYGDLIWPDNCTVGNSELLECVQYESAKVVTGAIAGTNSKSLREELVWEEFSTRRKTHKLSHFYKIVNKSTAPYLVDLYRFW